MPGIILENPFSVSCLVSDSQALLYTAQNCILLTCILTVCILGWLLLSVTISFTTGLS